MRSPPALPPRRGPPSSSLTDMPRPASSRATVRPASPPPMTSTSGMAVPFVREWLVSLLVRALLGPLALRRRRSTHLPPCKSGDHHRELRPFTGHALNRHAAAVRGHHLADYPQPQPDSAVLMIGRRSREALEDALQVD